MPVTTATATKPASPSAWAVLMLAPLPRCRSKRSNAANSSRRCLGIEQAAACQSTRALCTLSHEQGRIHPGGLLSKVVRFVKNPTVNWTELDSPGRPGEPVQQADAQGDDRAQAPQRLCAAPRVRSAAQAAPARGLTGPAGGRRCRAALVLPEQHGITDERAVTLKKIDEIEAQMSQQWWKSKRGRRRPTQPG